MQEAHWSQPPITFMLGFGPNCLCARWKQPGCWLAASSAWDLHLAQEAPALICPGQVACHIDAVLFLGSHTGVVENGLPFGLIPPLYYLFIRLPSESLLTPSAPQICSDQILGLKKFLNCGNSRKISGTRAQQHCSAGSSLPGNKLKSFHFLLKARGNLHLPIPQHPIWLLVQPAPGLQSPALWALQSTQMTALECNETAAYQE